MSDVILEIVRSVILLGIIAYLINVGRGRAELSQKGWWLIITGFLLLLFGSVVDITDNFESLNKFIVIGNTPTQAFLEKMVGFLGGFFVLAIGLVRWIPTITAVGEIKSLVKKLEHAKAEMEDRNRLLQLIYDNIPVMISLYSPENEILFANKALEETLGWNFDEIKRDNILKKYYPDPEERKKVMKFMSNSRDEWKDFKTTTREGKIVDTSWYNVHLSDNTSIGIGQDITARIKAEEEINNLAKFPSENPNPVLRVSMADGILIYANNASKTELGEWRCDVGKKVPDSYRKHIEESIKTSKNKMFDVTINENVFSFLAVPLVDSSYVNLYGRNVTKEREIEQMKNDFVSLVSHQLKTPVAQIKGYIDNMLSGLTGDLTEKQRKYLKDMENISSRNYRLISNLLNLSQIERGIISMNIQQVKMSEIVDVVVQEYKEIAEGKGLLIKINKPKSEVAVSADKDKTIEVLSNIVNNATKFTDKGLIIVTIKSDDNYGIIEVSDDGKGMSKDILEHLFEKKEAFKGVPIPRSGSGLGLYIAKSFMKQQNGDIEVTSTVNKGSSFVIKIPLANA